MSRLGIFGATTIEYRNPTYETDHGSRVLAWPDTWSTLDGCDVQDPATQTDTQHRQGMKVQYTLYMSADTPVKDNARVRYLGQELQVDGMVQRITDPLGLLAYAKATLKAWEG
jgi:hypothetical protein